MSNFCDYSVWVVYTNGNKFDVATGCNWKEAIEECQALSNVDQGATFSHAVIRKGYSGNTVAFSTQKGQVFDLTAMTVVS